MNTPPRSEQLVCSLRPADLRDIDERTGMAAGNCSSAESSAWENFRRERFGGEEKRQRQVDVAVELCVGDCGAALICSSALKRASRARSQRREETDTDSAGA